MITKKFTMDVLERKRSSVSKDEDIFSFCNGLGNQPS